MPRPSVALGPFLGMLLVLGCGLHPPADQTIGQPPTRLPVHPLFEPVFNLFGGQPAPDLAPPPRRPIQVASLSVAPRSGRWRFEPETALSNVPPFTLALDVQPDGTLTVVGVSDSQRRPSGSLASSYIKPVADGERTDLIAYLMLDRLYRMTVTSPTTMKGDAWFGIRPPQVVGVSATWIAP